MKYSLTHIIEKQNEKEEWIRESETVIGKDFPSRQKAREFANTKAKELGGYFGNFKKCKNKFNYSPNRWAAGVIGSQVNSERFNIFVITEIN